jgi:hypothetical protein
VPDDEGEKSDFEDLDLPGEGLPDLEELAEPAASVDQDAAPMFDGFPVAESPVDEGPEAESKEDETEEDAEEKGGFLKALSNANPYTVMLAVALAFILMAFTWLLLEWSTYNFDMGASEYKQRAE